MLLRYVFNIELVFSKATASLSHFVTNGGIGYQIIDRFCKCLTICHGYESPVLLGSIASLQPGTSVVITGLPVAAASSSTLGKPSLYEGRQLYVLLSLCLECRSDVLSILQYHW